MKLGDFFKSAPLAKPVNPGEVKFMLWSKDRVLPGGHDNHQERMIKADCTACFIYLDGTELEKITQESKQALNDKRDPAGKPIPWDRGDFVFEQMYRELFACMREYDLQTKVAGGAFFDQLKPMKKLLIPREAERVHSLWTKWLEDEHGGAQKAETFREGEEGDQNVVGGEPG